MKTEEQASVYQHKVTGLFGLIVKNQKVLSGLGVTLFVALILGIVGFTYKTATLPAQEKQINDIKEQVSRVVQYQANDVVDKAIQKFETNQLKKSLDRVEESTNRGFEEIKAMIRSNTGIVKQIDKNTK